MRRWFGRVSFERRLVALVIVALVALGAVSAVGYRAISRLGDEVDELVDDQALAAALSDVDMLHDALRGDVALALLGDDATDAMEVPNLAQADAQRLLERLGTANEMIGRLDLPDDDPLAVAMLTVEDDLATYSNQALAIIDLADDAPEAARAELTEFLTRFDRLRAELAAMNGLVTSRVTDAQQRARATSRDDATQTLVLGALALAALVTLAAAAKRSVRSMLDEKDAAEQEANRISELAQRDAERQEFKNSVNDALEMVDDEIEIYDVTSRALARVSDDRGELQLADNSRAHLRVVLEHPVAGGPGCPVQSPFECVAVRRGQTMVFESSENVNVCPKLRDRPYGPCSAVCVPVSFMGRAVGVLHTTAENRQPPDTPTVQRLTVLATEIGTRIGTVRAFATTQLQAATDSLTGLANRRTLEEHVAQLTRELTPFCLAVADLDHFKQINDAHGHDAGDRALRLFARVLRASVRSVDLVARYGGEEFIVVLPNCETDEAAGTLERVRERLALELLDGRSPAFTTSFGLTQVTPGTTLDEAVVEADAALYEAKANGRNRVVTTRTATAATPERAG